MCNKLEEMWWQFIAVHVYCNSVIFCVERFSCLFGGEGNDEDRVCSKNVNCDQVVLLPHGVICFSKGSVNWDNVVTYGTAGWFRRFAVIRRTLWMINFKGAYIIFAMSVCPSVRTSSDYSCITATSIFITLTVCTFINTRQHVPFDCYRITIMKTAYEKLRVWLCVCVCVTVCVCVCDCVCHDSNCK